MSRKVNHGDYEGFWPWASCTFLDDSILGTDVNGSGTGDQPINPKDDNPFSKFCQVDIPVEQLGKWYWQVKTWHIQVTTDAYTVDYIFNNGFAPISNAVEGLSQPFQGFLAQVTNQKPAIGAPIQNEISLSGVGTGALVNPDGLHGDQLFGLFCYRAYPVDTTGKQRIITPTCYDPAVKKWRPYLVLGGGFNSDIDQWRVTGDTGFSSVRNIEPGVNVHVFDGDVDGVKIPIYSTMGNTHTITKWQIEIDTLWP
jgi:hypothetical protein